MQLIRIRALEVLQRCIEIAVPALAGRVCAGSNKHPDQLQFPSAALVSTRANYFPDQAVEHSIPSPNVGVFNIGRAEAIVQIRIGASNDDERYILEDALLTNVFLQDLQRPGIVKLTIPDCEDALVVFELDDCAWEDEFAFENKWYSVLTAALQMPVLVRKGGLYSIDEICLQLTEDLDTPVASISAGDIETTLIDETTTC